MQGEECQLAGLNPVDDRLAISRRNLPLPHVPPPDEHIAVIQYIGADAFVRIILPHRMHLQARLGLEMIGNGVTKEILVRRLLSRLLLVPNHHANVSACHRKRGKEKKKNEFHAALVSRARGI